MKTKAELADTLGEDEKLAVLLDCKGCGHGNGSVTGRGMLGQNRLTRGHRKAARKHMIGGSSKKVCTIVDGVRY